MMRTLGALILSWSILLQPVTGYAGNITNKKKARIEAYRNSATGVSNYNAKNGLLAANPEEDQRLLSEEQLKKKGYKDLEDFLFGGQPKRNVWKDTIKQFPMESALFAVATGFVIASQMLADYKANPMAMDQHLESLKDPIGHISFYMFMVTNRSVIAPLLKKYQNTKTMKHFVPYIGMTTGMMASHITTEVLHLLKPCAKEILADSKGRPKDFSQCRASWDELVVSEKIVDMMPGLASMLGSTFIAGVIQKGGSDLLKKGMASYKLKKEANVLLKESLRLSSKELLTFAKMLSIEVGITMAPGGLVVRSTHLVSRLAQFAGFLALDMLWLNPLITKPFNNVVKGDELRRLSNTITHKFLTEDYDADLLEELTEFHRLMNIWRDTNMMKVTTAHQGWQDNIGKFISTYVGASDFYSHFYGELEALEKNPSRSALGYSYYLNGVVPTAPPQDQQMYNDWIIESPQRAEAAQLKTVERAAKYLRENIGDGKFINSRNVLNHEYQKAVRIRDRLSSKNKAELIEGLRELGQIFDPFLGQDPTYTPKFTNLFANTREFLGHPSPELEPGRGYLTGLLVNSTYGSNFIEFEIPFRRGRYAHELPTEFFIYQMACGPTPYSRHRDSLTEQSWAFADYFLPPRLLAANPETKKYCENMTPSLPVNEMFKERLFEDLKKKNLHDPSLSQIGIYDWWEQYVNPQFFKSWEGYASKYYGLINNWLGELKVAKDDATNLSPIFNNPLLASKQELGFNLTLIGTLLERHIDQSIKNNLLDGETKNLIPSLYVENPQKVKAGKWDPNYKATPLIYTQRFNPPMNIESLVAPYNPEYQSKATGRQLRFQKLIHELYSKLVSDIMSIKTISVESYNKDGKRLYQHQLSDRLLEIDTSIDAIGEQMDYVTQLAKSLRLPEKQLQVLSKLSTASAELAMNLKLTVSIISAVSADPISAPQFKDGKEIEKKVRKDGSLMTRQ